MATDWSRDGRFIAFTNAGFAQIESEQQADVWLIDLASQRKVIHLLNTPFHEANAVFSPNVEGERHLFSRQGAICLRWRSDGKELFYRLYAVPVTLSPQLKIGTPAPLFSIRAEKRAAVLSIVGFDVSANGQRLLVPTVTSQESSSLVVIQNWEAVPALPLN